MKRWMQPDTIVPGAGNPQALNRFSYSLNNPVKYTDPSGHDPIDFLGQFFAGVAFQWSVSNREAVLPSSPDQRQAVEALAVDSNAFVAGRVLGGLAAVSQGLLEVDAGAGTIGGGAVACGTGVLCPAGVGAVAGGTIAVAHGASVAVQGAAAAGQQAGILFSKGRSGQTLQQKLEGIFEDNPATSGECKACAQQTVDAFEASGQDAQIVQVGDKYQGQILKDANGNIVSNFGWHQTVQVGDRYYDALTGVGGATWDEYVKLWDPEVILTIQPVSN